MRVDDGLHVGPAQVDLRVQVEFHRRLPVARQRTAVETDLDEVFDGDATAHRIGGIDQHSAGVGQAGAEVAVEVDHLRSLEH